jgi:dUTP pyrophosphatase
MIPVVRFKKLTHTARLPVKATAGAACYDLFADQMTVLDDMRTYRVIGTGIAIELPPGHVGMVCSRSGIAAKSGMFVLNAPGIIDEDYRGELKVILGRLPFTPQWISDELFQVDPGMRIAQLMVMPIPQYQIEEVYDLTDTARGAGGLGSTGA